MDPQIILFVYNKATNKVVSVVFLSTYPKPIDSIYNFCSKLNLSENEEVFLAGVVFAGVTVDSVLSCCRLFEDEIYHKNIFLLLTRSLLSDKNRAKREIDNFLRRQDEVQKAIEDIQKNK